MSITLQRTALLALPLGFALSLGFPATAAQEPEVQPEVQAGGVIPLRLSETQTSYLGVALEEPEVWDCGGGLDTGRGTHDARLVIVNDGGSSAPWGATIPLRVVASSVEGDVTRTETHAEAFDLAGPRAWQSACGDFTYFTRLDRSAPQPVSTLTLIAARDGSAAMFAGTLYVNALLYLTHVGTGETYVQPLRLALNPAGRWVAVEPGHVPDPTLSNLLLFADLENGALTDRSACVGERHPLGQYCLQLPAALLEAFAH